MKTSPINNEGLPKSLNEYKTEKEMYESARKSQEQAEGYARMLESILK